MFKTGYKTNYHTETNELHLVKLIIRSFNGNKRYMLQNKVYLAENLINIRLPYSIF